MKSIPQSVPFNEKDYELERYLELNKEHNLQKFSLTSIILEESDVARVCKFLSTEKVNLTAVDINISKITLEGFKELAQTLSSLQGLTFLSLGSFPSECGAAEGEILANTLSKLRSLKELIISNSTTTPGGLKELAETLSSLQGLTSLNLGSFSSEYGATEGKILVDTLSELRSLKELVISNSNITSEFIEPLAISLPQTLEKLDLQDNFFQSNVGQILADKLPKTLKELDLSRTLVTQDQVLEIARKCNTLMSLNIDRNEAYELSGIIDALFQNKVITQPLYYQRQYVYEDRDKFNSLLNRNKGYVKKFAEHLQKIKPNIQGSTKFLNLGDIQYFLSCDHEYLKTSLWEEHSEFAWNRKEILKYWQNNFPQILGICKTKQGFFPKASKFFDDLAKHIFSFISPYDFNVEDFVIKKHYNKDISLVETQANEEVSIVGSMEDAI